MGVSTPTLVTFSVYIALMLGIGLWAWRSTKNFSDYILGGRSLGSFVTTMSAGALTLVLWKQYSGIDLYEIIAGFAFATAAIYLVSVLGKGPSAAMVTRFCAADKTFHQEKG